MTDGHILAAAPVLVPLVTALLAALAARHARLQGAISTVGIVLFLGVALALLQRAGTDLPATVVFGAWPAPYGIEFHIDRLSAAMVLIAALSGAVCLLFLTSDADTGPRSPLLLPLLHGMLAGVSGAFCTADLFNLYVWFEVILVCALGLFALGGRPDQLDATFKYLTLNMFGTMLLLLAIAFIYAATGHLNYNALAHAWPLLPAQQTTLLIAALSIAFLAKAGAFPLFAWLPASYHTLPAPVVALFAALLTKVGVYAVLRMLGDVFAPAPPWLHSAIGWIAAATMLAGVLGAAYHWDMRRILAFHSLSQVGYMLLGISLGSLAGQTATLFYIVHHSLVKASLFLIVAIVFRLTGSYDLRQIGGLYAARPGLSMLFLAMALSLVGIPPLSGFWAKLLVLRETIAGGHWSWTAIALAVSLLTLYSMMKIWLEAFWKPHPTPGFRAPAARLMPAFAASGVLAALALAVGLHPQALLAYAQAAAATLGGR